MGRSDDDRLLGHRDGIISAMLIVRREMGQHKQALRLAPEHHVRKRKALENTIAMLQRIDDALDRRRQSNTDAYRERMSVEIVSPHRPPVDMSELKRA